MRALLAAAAAALVAVAVVAPGLVAHPGPGYELPGNATGHWTHQCPPGSCAVVFNDPRRDLGTARFELRPGLLYSDGTPRSEMYAIPLYGTQPDYIEEGDDLYIGWSVKPVVQVSTATCWQVLTQFKQRVGPGAGGSPPLALEISGSGDRIRFKRNLSPSVDYWWDQAAGYRNKWTDFVAHVKFSKDPAVGFVELWVNGTQRTLTNGQLRMSGGTMDPSGQPSYMKVGYYRDPSCNSTGANNVNGVRIGATYADVKYP